MNSESRGGAAASRQLQHGLLPHMPASSSQVRPRGAGGALCCIPATLEQPHHDHTVVVRLLFSWSTPPRTPARRFCLWAAQRARYTSIARPGRYGLSPLLGLGLAMRNSHWPWPERLRFQRRLQADCTHTRAASLHAVASELEGARPVQPMLVSSQLLHREGGSETRQCGRTALVAEGHKRSGGLRCAVANVGLGLGMLAHCQVGPPGCSAWQCARCMLACSAHLASVGGFPAQEIECERVLLMPACRTERLLPVQSRSGRACPSTLASQARS